MTKASIDALAKRLFSLEKPWRSRFLRLLANRAKESLQNELLPAREQVAGWLYDPDMYLEFTQLLAI